MKHGMHLHQSVTSLNPVDAAKQGTMVVRIVFENCPTTKFEEMRTKAVCWILGISITSKWMTLLRWFQNSGLVISWSNLTFESAYQNIAVHTIIGTTFPMVALHINFAHSLPSLFFFIDSLIQWFGIESSCVMLMMP